jgi:hypothetical protein
MGKNQKVDGKNDGAMRRHFSHPLFERIHLAVVFLKIVKS